MKNRKSEMRMKNLVIVGTGNFADLMHYYLNQYDSRRVVAFSVERDYIQEPMFHGLPVYPFEELSRYCPPVTHEVLLAIGAKEMNQLRARLFRICKSPISCGGGYDIASFIHPSSIISPNAQIGEGNIILENVVVQPFVKIGDGNLIWYNAVLAHNDQIGNFNTIAGGAALAGFVTVGNHCYLGKNSTVFKRAIIADSTLIGACAYVKENTKPYDVIMPARSITLDGKKSTDFTV